jgi:TetR/AcrR family transcriptional repressor of mexJK operon
MGVKHWPADHPKATLMARKRGQILAAAREAFLRLGYEGASMEAIAEAAGVSIMTLYRHADGKDDLFAAVIASACDPNDEAEREQFETLMKKPLREVLVVLGLVAQKRLADPDTVALMRAVMAETVRFPELGERAYRGFVGHLEEMIAEALLAREESRGRGKAACKRLGILFIDRLFGSDMLRILLGLGGVSSVEQRKRSERAVGEVMAVLEPAA